MAVKCPKCQFENAEGIKFCGECGAKLERVCPQCHFRNAPGIKFCGECGHDLRETAAPAPVDYSQPQTYTPKFLADKILSSSKALEGERKIVTVLFADLAGYTPMSEKLDPEEVHQIMDGCFHILMDEIHRYEGTIDKFTGDGVMALFGAPIAHEDHAQRACYAALAIQKALKPYGQKIENELGISFKMRLGLNSGPVIVSSIGTDLKMEYSAVGDTVNLASRLQTTATPDSVLVSRDVHKMTRDFFRFKPLGKLEVKGKQDKVEAYELLEPSEIATRIEASIVRGLTRFVGRKKEMATLKEAFDLAQSGSGQVVCIVGEAGVGKSRLLLELRRSLSHRDHAYLEGHCLHYGSSMPYLPILDILRSYFSIKEGDREFLIKKTMEEKLAGLDGGLKGILPPLHDLLSLKVEDESYARMESQKKRERIFEAIRDLLIRESQNQPLVIAIEDLHWIDRTSEDFLKYFIDWLPNSHILLLPLYRPEYCHQWGSRSCYSQIRVDELPLKSSAELVSYILEDADVAPELRDLVLKRAAGNPLFMEEFTLALMENGSIQKKDHEYFLAAKVGDLHVPDTIQGIIAARMDRLDDNLKRIMQVASVIGRDFAYRILQTITGMQEELKSHLLNLQGLEFIYEKNLFPELEYVFKHALTQEVAYNSLLVKRRKDIHASIARAIEDLYPDRLEEFYEPLAFHYKRGECPDKAIEYLIKAGEKSFDRYAVQEAHQHFQDAFDILSRKPARTREEDRLLIDMLIKWAYVYYFRGDFKELTELLKAHLNLAESLEDQERTGMFYAWYGFAMQSRARLPESYQWLHQGLQIGEEAGSQRLIAYACCWLAWTCASMGLLDEAITLGERALSLAGSFEGDQYLHYKTLGALGHAYWTRGHKRKAAEYAESMLEYGRQHGSIRGLALGYYVLGESCMTDGDYSSALEAFEQGAQVAVDPFYVLICRFWLGAAYNFMGQYEKGESILRAAQAQCHELGTELMGYTAEASLSLMVFAMGQTDEALRMADDAIKNLLGSGTKPSAAMTHLWLGKIHTLLAGSVPDADQKALHHFDAAIALARETGMHGLLGEAYLDLGRFYLARSDKDQAREYLSSAVELFQQCGLENYLGQAREALAAAEQGIPSAPA
jgi:class 3 adenylate cyclase/tetratricopeptide (TPR) repeat protein